MRYATKPFSPSEKRIADRCGGNRLSYYQRLKAEGICVSCKSRPAGDTVRCVKCQQEKKERRLGEVGPGTYAQQAAKQRGLYEERRAAGLCVSCLKKWPTSARCDACQEKRRLRRSQAGGEADKHCQNCGSAGHQPMNCHIVRPRCRCGLTLPCNSCLPSAYEVAGNRREWA